MRVLTQRWGAQCSAAFTLYTYHPHPQHETVFLCQFNGAKRYHMFVRGGGHPGEHATRHIFKPIALPVHPLDECAASLQMPSLWLFGALFEFK